MSALAFCGVWVFRDAIVEVFGEPGATVCYLLPAGMVLSGAWSLSSAWAVRVEASSTLGLARLVQPLLMTALQLAAGAIAPSGVALLAAHLVSHLVYSSFIGRSELTRADLAVMRALRPKQLVALALRNRNFPFLALPAQVSSLSVSNLPPIILSWFYGAGVAGHYGVAYRLVIAPLTIASIRWAQFWLAVWCVRVARGKGAHSCARFSRSI